MCVCMYVCARLCCIIAFSPHDSQMEGSYDSVIRFSALASGKRWSSPALGCYITNWVPTGKYTKKSTLDIFDSFTKETFIGEITSGTLRFQFGGSLRRREIRWWLTVAKLMRAVCAFSPVRSIALVGLQLVMDFLGHSMLFVCPSMQVKSKAHCKRVVG